MKKKLLLIFLLALLLFTTRFFRIASNPPSIYWDEASIGYNAYSVLKTGKDEWGEFLPLHFRAFGEFKLPVYIYSVAASEIFFGLEPIAIRLPSVLFSLGTTILVFLIASIISKKFWVGLLSALTVCVSPWFFIFSRTGYEATAGLMFFLLGIYSFLLVGKHKLFLFVGLASWIVSIYSYNSFRILIPLVGAVMVVLFLAEIKANMKKYWKIGLISMLFAAISLLPIAKLYFRDTGAIRFQTVAVTSFGDFVNNYVSHFSPNFLFIGGDVNPRSQQPGFGEIYLLDLPLIILGIILISKKAKKLDWLLLLILLASPVPAALTRESPHALRAITMAPILAIISSLGALFLVGKFRKYKSHILGGLVIAYLAFFVNYIRAFYNTYPTLSSQDWQYGYERLFVDYASDIAKSNKVVISDEYGQPYIFALLYLKYDPATFQKEEQRNPSDKWGASSIAGFNKFVFKKVEAQDLTKGALVIATPKDKPKGLEPYSEIKFLDGTEAFWVYKP